MAIKGKKEICEARELSRSIFPRHKNSLEE